MGLSPDKLLQPKWGENTLETGGKDAKITLDTSGKDSKTTVETSGKDAKTTLEKSGKDVKIHSKRVEKMYIFRQFDHISR